MSSNDTDTARLLNTGKEVTLKKLGDVTVREFSLEALLESVNELSVVLQKIDFTETTGAAVIPKLLGDTATFEALLLLASKSCGHKPSDLRDMGISDWVKLFNALREVVDWEELRNLFIEMGLGTRLNRLAERANPSAEVSQIP
jgi:hypothetical protein